MFKALHLDPAVGLEKQLLFWLAIGVPIVAALCLGLPVWIHHELEFSHAAYSNFLEISKFPLGVSSLAIPLSILVGKLHGAKQAAIQIENTRRQIASAEIQIQNTLTQIGNTEQDNKTKLYISHFEHFCKHMDFVEAALIRSYSSIFAESVLPIVNKLALYKFIYPRNSLHSGVAPMGEHFKVFAANAMARLSRSYKEFLWAQTSSACEERLIALEQVLHNVQVRCFHCRESRQSIFVKEIVPPEHLKKSLHFGVNPEPDDYLAQVHFFAQLLDGIESFEIPDPMERIAHLTLAPLSVPFGQKPSESEVLVTYWKMFREEAFD
jgi:hypothetical protein